MQKQLIFPAALGVIGAAILLSLCVWQVQRMAWKNGILAQIDARIVADPVALPLDLDPVADKYLPVFVKGTTGTDEILVLTSQSNLRLPVAAMNSERVYTISWSVSPAFQGSM